MPTQPGLRASCHFSKRASLLPRRQNPCSLTLPCLRRASSHLADPWPSPHRSVQELRRKPLASICCCRCSSQLRPSKHALGSDFFHERQEDEGTRSGSRNGCGLVQGGETHLLQSLRSAQRRVSYNPRSAQCNGAKREESIDWRLRRLLYRLIGFLIGRNNRECF